MQSQLRSSQFPTIATRIQEPEVFSTLNRVVANTLIAFGISTACLAVFGIGGERDKLFVSENFKLQEYHSKNLDALFNNGAIAWVKKYGQGAVIIDTATDNRWQLPPDITPPPLWIQAQSALMVPIQVAKQVLGLLLLTAPVSAYFDTRDLRTMTIVADTLAAYLYSIHRLKEEEANHQLIASLTEIAQTINSTLDLDQVLNLILEHLDLVVEFDSASVLLYEEETRTLFVQAARGHPDMIDALQVRIPLTESSPNYQAIIQQKPVILGDVDKVPGWIKTSSSQSVRSWIGVPLIVRNQTIGMLTVDSHEVNKYQEKDAQIVQTFANYVVTAVANAQIVSQLKNVESSYAALFEDSTDLIIITTYQGEILNVNRKAAQMLRLPKDALVGIELGFLYPELSDFLASQRRRLKAWREASLEIDLQDAYHQPLALEFRVRQVNYAGKDCVQWVGRDISARKEIERMRQDLVDMLVHDIRGPVGNLINIIEMLPMLVEAGNDAESINRMLDLAHQTGQEVRDLLDTMLDVSRLEKGNVPLQRDIHNLQDIMQVVEKQVASHAELKNITLTIEPLPPLPPIWIDASMIRRLLVNLIDNAIKYTQSGGWVRVSAARQKDTLKVSVSDNGPGIPPSEQEHIFQKFGRITTRNGPSGVGLGLAFCKLAAEAHGGSISVDSEGIPGKGSTFTLTIPMILDPQP